MAQEPQLQDLDSDPDDELDIPEVPAFDVPEDKPEDIEIEMAVDEDTPEEQPEPQGLERNEDDDLPAKIRKRVQREEKLKWQARKEADEARKEAAEARLELAKLRAEKEAGGIDAQVAAAREKYAKARSDGDVEAEAAAMTEVASLEAKKATLRAQPEQPKPAERPRVSQAQEKWLERNKWYDTDKFSHQSDVAYGISEELKGEGRDPGEEDFWQELDRRLNESVKLPSAPKPRAPVNGGDRPSSASPKRYRFTNEDRAEMVRFRLDPNDPKARLEWARNKLGVQ